MARLPKAARPENENGAKKVKTKDQRSEKPQLRYKVTEADREGSQMTLEEMIADERTITNGERINIVVEYACLGQDPKPEKYIGRPRYIKPSRHGRTRLAKRSARRDDIPPPEEKMLVYDEEVALRLYGEKHTSLRRPGAVVEEPSPSKDVPMEEDENAKEHSRDSGCPVSPADKPREDADKKEEGGSSRGSVEKESRKRRSPDLLNDEPHAISGMSHFIVKGNTPLTVIRKLLELKRQIPEELRLELVDASGKQILDENSTVARLANDRKWTRNGPLRILYTITRCLETEDAPVLDVQEPCTMQQQPGQLVPAATPAEAAAARSPSTPSPQQLAHMQHMQHLQQQQQLHQQQMLQQQPFPNNQMVMIRAEDGSQLMVPYSTVMMHQQHLQQDHEGLLKMSAPHGGVPPSHPHPHHFVTTPTPPTFGGGASTMPHPGQLQQQMTSSIFPPGHVIVEHGNGSHLVAANMSVESVISNPASVKKRQRMAPKRTRDRDELMARRGIEKGATIAGKGAKMGLPFNIGSLPGISSIRMPPGCDPSMLRDPRNMAELPIEAITDDGKTHATTLAGLPALA
ncbi:hypothetical protein PENTCL1PPCAC_13709, partial [Pristionchus entomophagus]